MRGVIGPFLVVVVACSESYGDASAGADAGDGGAPAIEVTPAELQFGTAACGATTAPQILVLRNRSATTTRYSLELPQGAAFEVQGPLEGELAPDSVTAVNVVARPTKAAENVSSVIVSAGQTLVQIPLAANGEGASIEFTPSVADIGEVRRENGGSVEVAIANRGTKPITLTGFDATAADFSGSWSTPGALTLEPNTSNAVTVKLASGADSPVLDGELRPKLEGPLCGTPAPLAVRGRRVNQDVTISPADFGNQGCATNPTLTRDVVISNYTASALSYSATLKSGAASAFTIVSGATDSIPAGNDANPSVRAVKLGLKPIGTMLGPVTEAVDVQVSGISPPAGGLRTVNATFDVRGIVLTVTPNNSTGFDNDETRTFVIRNAGNIATGSISTAFVRDPGTTQAGAWVSNFPSNLAAGAQANVNVQFNPSYQGNYAGTWTLNTNPTACNGPPTLHVQGSVTN